MSEDQSNKNTVPRIEEILGKLAFYDNVHLCVGPSVGEVSGLFAQLFDPQEERSSHAHFTDPLGIIIDVCIPQATLTDRLAQLSPPLTVKTLLTARCGQSGVKAESPEYEGLIRQLIHLGIAHQWDMAYVDPLSEVIAVHYGGRPLVREE